MSRRGQKEGLIHAETMHELFDGSEAQSLMLWRRYIGNDSVLPVPFFPALIHKGGKDGGFIGVFSGYRPEREAVWMPHNAVTGPLPIEPGDWWMPYPEPPEEEE